MKWIIILLLIAAGVWAYFNVDFTGAKNNAQESTMNAIKNEKTINNSSIVQLRNFCYDLFTEASANTFYAVTSKSIVVEK